MSEGTPTSSNGNDQDPKLLVKLLLIGAAIVVTILVLKFLLPALRPGTLGPSSILQ